MNMQTEGPKQTSETDLRFIFLLNLRIIYFYFWMIDWLIFYVKLQQSTKLWQKRQQWS